MSTWIDLGSTYQNREAYAHPLLFGRTYLFYSVDYRRKQVVGVIGTIDLISVPKGERDYCLKLSDYPLDSGAEKQLIALFAHGYGDISHRIMAYNWDSVEAAVFKQLQVILRRYKRAA